MARAVYHSIVQVIGTNEVFCSKLQVMIIFVGYDTVILPTVFTLTFVTTPVGFVKLIWVGPAAVDIPLLLNPQVLAAVIFTPFSNVTGPFIRVSTPLV